MRRTGCPRLPRQRSGVYSSQEYFAVCEEINIPERTTAYGPRGFSCLSISNLNLSIYSSPPLDSVGISVISYPPPQRTSDMPIDTAIAEISDAIHTVQERDDLPGEINVYVSKKRKKIDPINAFALCFTGSLSTIILDKKLSPTAIALLLLLLDLAKFGNLVSVNQKGLAARLKVKQPAISKALAKLVDAAIIIELPEGQFFNPQLITRQGLDTVARNHPAAVIAGIEALRNAGMKPNWQPHGP